MNLCRYAVRNLSEIGYAVTSGRPDMSKVMFDLILLQYTKCKSKQNEGGRGACLKVFHIHSCPGP
jgi:hypothetical protein